MKKLFTLFLLLSSFLFAVSTNNILALSWENTYCKFHHSKECERRSLYSYNNFTLHGLWPKNKIYCHSKYKFKLSPLLEMVLQKFMPGAKYGLAWHEWKKHGTCFGTDAETYFLTAIKLTQQFNETNFVGFFQTHIGQYVSLARLRFLFGGTFGNQNRRKFQLLCIHGYIAEIRIPLKGNPVKEGLQELINNANPMIGVKQCQGGIITAP